MSPKVVGPSDIVGSRRFVSVCSGRKLGSWFGVSDPVWIMVRGETITFVDRSFPLPKTVLTESSVSSTSLWSTVVKALVSPIFSYSRRKYVKPRTLKGSKCRFLIYSLLRDLLYKVLRRQQFHENFPYGRFHSLSFYGVWSGRPELWNVMFTVTVPLVPSGDQTYFLLEFHF